MRGGRILKISKLKGTNNNMARSQARRSDESIQTTENRTLSQTHKEALLTAALENNPVAQSQIETLLQARYGVDDEDLQEVARDVVKEVRALLERGAMTIHETKRACLDRLAGANEYTKAGSWWDKYNASMLDLNYDPLYAAMVLWYENTMDGSPDYFLRFDFGENFSTLSLLQTASSEHLLMEWAKYQQTYEFVGKARLHQVTKAFARSFSPEFLCEISHETMKKLLEFFETDTPSRSYSRAGCHEPEEFYPVNYQGYQALADVCQSVGECFGVDKIAELLQDGALDHRHGGQKELVEVFQNRFRDVFTIPRVLQQELPYSL